MGSSFVDLPRACQELLGFLEEGHREGICHWSCWKVSRSSFPACASHRRSNEIIKVTTYLKEGKKIFSKAESSRDAKNIQGNKGTQWKGQQSLCSPATGSCSERGQLGVGTRSKTHGTHPNNNNNPPMARPRECPGHRKGAGRQEKVSS